MIFVLNDDLLELVVIKSFEAEFNIFVTNVCKNSSIWIKWLLIVIWFFLSFHCWLHWQWCWLCHFTCCTSFGNDASFDILKDHDVLDTWSNIFLKSLLQYHRIKQRISIIAFLINFRLILRFFFFFRHF